MSRFRTSHATLSVHASFIPGTGALEGLKMANSSFETFKQGGEAIDKAAEKTGQEAEGIYEQAKGAASAKH